MALRDCCAAEARSGLPELAARAKALGTETTGVRHCFWSGERARHEAAAGKVEKGAAFGEEQQMTPVTGRRKTKVLSGEEAMMDEIAQEKSQLIQCETQERSGDWDWAFVDVGGFLVDGIFRRGGSSVQAGFVISWQRARKDGACVKRG